jgi:hypothetical protein
MIGKSAAAFWGGPAAPAFGRPADPNPTWSPVAPRLLRRVQPPPIAAGAHESAGHRAGGLAALENRSPCDESGLVAPDALDEAATSGRHVVDQFGLVEPQAIEVNQVYVGAQSGREPAAVFEAEEVGGLAGLASRPRIGTCTSRW